MKHLSNELLIEAYIMSIKLELPPEFLLLLREEIEKRHLPLIPSA